MKANIYNMPDETTIMFFSRASRIKIYLRSSCVKLQPLFFFVLNIDIYAMSEEVSQHMS